MPEMYRQHFSDLSSQQKKLEEKTSQMKKNEDEDEAEATK